MKYVFILLILIIANNLICQNWINLTKTPSARETTSSALIGGSDLVLIFGGKDGGDGEALLIDDETWIYDISQSKWTKQNPINKPTARYTHSLEYIGDDKVLLFGGFDINGFSNETWIYDLSEGNWTKLNPQNSPAARGWHSMTKISINKVLLFGGYQNGPRFNDTWVYDLSDGDWTQLNPANKPSERFGHTTCSLTDDKILLYGGSTVGDNDETWTFDLSEENWEQLNPNNKPTASSFHSMDYIGSDKVFLFRSNTAWVFDYSENDWMQLELDYKPTARVAHDAICYIGTDRVLLFGGGQYDYIFNDTWIFDLSEMEWNDLSYEPKKGGFFPLSYIDTDKILLLANSVTWIYDLSEDKWSKLSPINKPTSSYQTQCYIGSDKVLLFGGLKGGGVRTNETWLFDLSIGNWTELNPFTKPSSRYYHSMCYIGSDKVLLFGGDDGTRNDETWIFDLSEETWTQLNPLNKPTARYLHSMCYIGNDKVLLFGGNDGTRDNETWIFDLSEENWTLLNPTTKPSARFSHSLSYIGLINGYNNAILFGGNDGSYSNETWIFNEEDFNWTLHNPANKPQGRTGLSLTNLPNGTIFLFGGSNRNGVPLSDYWSIEFDIQILPILTTTSISSITLSGASSGGNITSQGGSAVTTRGVCWNTTGSPTISDSKTTDGSGTGSFTSSITGLTQSTIYYVRAYATNSAGTAYGNEVVFTTIPTLPEWGLIVFGALLAFFAVRKIIKIV